MSQGIHRRVYLRTLLAFRLVVATREPLSGVHCRVRESSMVAVGSGALTSERRGLVWRVLTVQNFLDGTVTRVVAYSNFSGVMGRSRMRFPVAW